MKIVGRKIEIELLQSLLDKEYPEFVAVYGRRRVGKTYLIRQVYKEQIVFECSGLHEKAFSQQLENFWLTLLEVDGNNRNTPMPKTWLQAFSQLKSFLNKQKGTAKKVVFLDEVPWFETPGAGFLAALDNFWNQYCSKREDIILVICGSAASWIIQKVINDRGGLHNRITTHVQLMPFTLAETKVFLEMNHVHLTLKDIVQLYMCIGGIPFYLKEVKAGKSVPQILDDLFFVQQASLRREFSNLYASLFKNSELHEQVVAALSTKNSGLTRSELLKQIDKKSGGGMTLVLQELVECGFIKEVFSMKSTIPRYRLVDEYSLFYFKFLANSRSKNSWLHLSNKPSYKIWSGYAFENVCFKHTHAIKKALGINGMITNEYAWYQRGDDQQAGAQIDLVIDRGDNCINLLEIKFHNSAYEITKTYAAQLHQKITAFKVQTRTRKNVFLTMLTVFGVKKNKYYLGVVTNQILIEELFES